MALTTAIFDLGGVVLRWDPRAAYADAAAPEEIERFMADVDWPEWNRSLDAGRPLAVAEAELAGRFPQWAHLVPLYREQNHRTIPGEIEGTAAVLDRLHAVGIRLLALTNWSVETFLPTRERFGVLDVFDGIVMSGAEGVTKPDPAIFALLCDRYRVAPGEAVFVDDSPTNVAAAQRFGLQAVLFRDADRLRADLGELGLPI